jgi:hypothetical protein
MNASTSRPHPRRLFRADSTSDVICAALVADTLGPGQSILAICGDKYAADTEALRECLFALSGLYSWDAVVDISGLPINRHTMGTAMSASRWAALRDTLRTAELLRRRLAGPFGVGAEADVVGALDSMIDELYVTCVYHSDVQTLVRILPSAKTFYYPHGFGCLMSSELLYYKPVLSDTHRNPVMLVKDAVRRVLWGRDAVPVRTVHLDGAYSFNVAMPWAHEQYSLARLENRATMTKLFERLPADVQGYYRALADSCDSRTGLLMVSGQSGTDFSGEEAEVEAHLHVARSMTARHNLSSLVVKPHPMGSSGWSERVVAALSSGLPAVELKVIDEHRYYPIELVMVPFSIASAGTVLSNALRNIRKIYDVPCYCPESRLLEVWRRTSRGAIADEWVAEARAHYTAV